MINNNDLNNKHIRRIQVPNILIVNRKLSHSVLELYVELALRTTKGDVSRLLVYELKQMGWKDNRTIKRNIEILYNLSLINKKIDRLPNNKSLDIKLIKPTSFTQVDVHTIQLIRKYSQEVKIKHQKPNARIFGTALRLFYYYEKNYNYNYGYAFPTYEDIKKDTGLHSSYIKGLNDMFQEKGLVDIKIGEQFIIVNKNGSREIRKKTNIYIPKCNRALWYL